MIDFRNACLMATGMSVVLLKVKVFFFFFVEMKVEMLGVSSTVGW